MINLTRSLIIIGILLVIVIGGGILVTRRSSHTPPPLLQDKSHKLPIVFHPRYDISLFGIEHLHPMDSKKFGKIFKHLVDITNINKNCFYQPEKLPDATLLKVHTQQYLDYLHYSTAIAEIIEVWPLQFIPNFLLQWKLLTPMRYATSGTILATQLAITYGWAINLGGGYHHAKKDSGGGFCFYADIPLALQILHEKKPDLTVLVVDLDAHQGNGLATFFFDDDRVALFDMYNKEIYPNDLQAIKKITFNIPVPFGIHDDNYLKLLKRELPRAIKSFQPSLIVYNAGTDIFIEDPLGGMNITEQGIINRDQFVFEQAINHNIPIVMLLGGGYAPSNASIISHSIENILKCVLNIIPNDKKES